MWNFVPEKVFLRGVLLHYFNSPGSLQLLYSGMEVLRRLEDAEVGPSEEGQQTSRRCERMAEESYGTLS